MSDIFCAGGHVTALYPTPDSMKRKIDEYFDYCLRITYDRDGNEKIKEFKVPTYSGLARYLGFQTRRQMLEYADKRDEAFGAVVADGCLRLEDYLEGKLVYSKAPAGIALSLKNNAGWEEKTTKQLTADNGMPIAFAWKGDTINTSATESQPPKELAEKPAEVVGEPAAQPSGYKIEMPAGFSFVEEAGDSNGNSE